MIAHWPLDGAGYSLIPTISGSIKSGVQPDHKDLIASRYA